MFSTNSSSSEEEGTQKAPATPFNAITAAAKAQRMREARNRRRLAAQQQQVEALAEPDPVPAQITSRKPQRKSRYIEKLVASVESRRQHAEQVAERRILAQQERDADPAEERFVTAAYRRVLTERAALDKRDAEEERAAAGRDKASVSKFSAGLFGVAKGGQVGRGEKSDRDEESTGAHRKSRFGDVNDVERKGAAAADGEKEKPERKKKRGLRRNDEAAIEAYRSRYFERVQAREQGVK